MQQPEYTNAQISIQGFGMSAIDSIMRQETAKWINGQINNLPDRAKFRAFSSIRSLQWANNIFEIGLPIPACYCALHATEEAVAAFISCAKECGYGDNAKINIKDHKAKAIVSLIASKVSAILQEYSIGVAFNPKDNTLAARYTVDGKIRCNEASTKLFDVQDENQNLHKDFYPLLVQMLGDIGEIKKAVSQGQEARNTIFYATSSGIPSGFLEPDTALRRECQIALGLIWAAIDIKNNEGEIIPFVDQALKTANVVISELKTKKN